MKIVRILLVLLAVGAVVSLGAYLYNKQKVVSVADNSTVGIIDSRTPQQTPSAAGVTLSNTTPSREVIVEASEYKFTPSTITLKKGETVKITLKNTGAMQHDWFVDGMGGANIDLTGAGSQNSIVITPSQKGTFTTYCSVGSHRKLGMVGKLVVE